MSLCPLKTIKNPFSAVKSFSNVSHLSTISLHLSMTTYLPFPMTTRLILSSFVSLVVLTLFFITRTGFSPSSSFHQPLNNTLRISTSSTGSKLQSPRSCNKIPPSLADALVHYASSNVTPQQTLSEISVTKKVTN